ncbi:MAG: hypothetical protein C0490_17125 [Marivirga sp.]|nr:hypothetical protein [Marivirga sp.]
MIEQSGNNRKIPAKPVPDDWSFVDVGSNGEFQSVPFKVTGRVRIQLRNDYKNFWCVEYNQGKCGWIIESFASFLFVASSWVSYEKDATKLRAGNSIPITSELKLKGEYVEKCEGISFQGEIGPWTSFESGFFIVQASDISGKAAIFFIENKKVEFLIGEKVLVEKLNLKNIIEWNEWK